MRKYQIDYWIEKNDESVDCEKIVEAENVLSALQNFLEEHRIIKRVISIKEIN